MNNISLNHDFEKSYKNSLFKEVKCTASRDDKGVFTARSIEYPWIFATANSLDGAIEQLQEKLRELVIKSEIYC